MTKPVLPSKFSEWKGLDRISTVVHEMRCIYREISKDDFGLDAEIEVVVPTPDGQGYTATGGIIKVQAKSGESYVKQDTASSFSTPVKQNDLLGWRNANYPVIFIVYHPKDNSLYWKDVKAYLKVTANVWQSPLRIAFDKATDIFSPEAYPTMCSLAAISPPRISFEQRERLFSNLLLVKKRPQGLTGAPTTAHTYSEIRSQIQGFAPPFCVVEGQLYTLADLRDSHCLLRPFCETEHIRDVLSRQWVLDDRRRHDYVFLLNQLLRQHMRRCGLRYYRPFDRYYFPRRDETSEEFKQDWFNVRTSRAAPERRVVKFYHYGVDTFWRHLAVNLSFKFVGDSLYLQVLPKYFFTEDGEIPCASEKVGPYTTRIKAMEHNIHVLNHVLFWTDVLSQRTPAIELQLNYRAIMLIEKLPLSDIAAFAIPSDPAVYDEPEHVEQLGLFDQLLMQEGGSENDEY